MKFSSCACNERRLFTAICVLFSFASFARSQQDLTIAYNGNTQFPGDTDAVLSCAFQPESLEGDSTTIYWSQEAAATRKLTKIAVSKSNVNDSFVYSSAPASLLGRFETSSTDFTSGLATATIRNVTIGDDMFYACEIDRPPMSKSDRFGISVYYEPGAIVKDVETALDIRPVPEQPEPTASTEEAGNETATTVAPTPAAPVDPRATVVSCHASGAYPRPVKFEFTSERTQKLFTVTEMDIVATPDGKFDASAVLRVTPTSDLDGSTIACAVVLIDADDGGARKVATPAANSSSVVTVRYLTSYAKITITPSTVSEGDYVTVTCEGDGNPAPSTLLTGPGGVAVTDPSYTFRAQRDLAGNYRCAAGNSDEQLADEQTLIVQYTDKPRISVKVDGVARELKNGNVTVNLKEHLELSCDGTGLPSPTMGWTAPVMGAMDQSDLVISSVAYNNGGYYMCTARGASSKSARVGVVVNGACAVVLSKEVAASKSSGGDAYVKLTCVATGVPVCAMKLTAKDGTQHGGQATYGENRVELEIEALKKQIEPIEFVCSASNNLGATVQRVTLNDEVACCAKPQAGGLGTGVIIIIIIIVALVIVVAPLGCYFYKKRGSKSAKQEKQLEAGEDEKLDPSDEIATTV